MESYQSLETLQKKYSEGYFLEIKTQNPDIEKILFTKFNKMAKMPTKESGLLCHLKLGHDIALSEAYEYFLDLRTKMLIEDFSIISASLNLFYGKLGKMQDY